MEVQIGPLPASSVSSAGDLLARAFRQDPLIGVLLGGQTPKSLRHRAAYPAFFRATVRELLASGRVDAAFVDGRLVGCAAWTKPEHVAEISPKDRLMLLVDRFIVRTLYQSGLRTIEASFDEIAALHPAEPHWYLAFVGVEPSMQGQRIGYRLLSPVLAAADALRQPCYLETPFAQTVAFYERMGFQVTRKLDEAFGGLGPLWTMLRPPAVPSEGRALRQPAASNG